MSLIETNKLSIGYDQALISDIKLTIESGCFYALIGDNGTGKSTFVKTLCGIIPPLSGSINYTIKPNDITFVDQKQEFNNYVPCTVQEFIELGAFDQKQISNKMLNTVIEEMGLTTFKDQSLWTLSGGQLRRTVLARALLCESKLMVLDEPLAALDHDSCIQFVETLKNIKERFQVTIIMISHNLNLLTDAADKVYKIDNKKLNLLDTKEDK